MVRIPVANEALMPVGKVPTVTAPLSPPPLTVNVIALMGNPIHAVSEMEGANTVQLHAIISTVVEVV